MATLTRLTLSFALCTLAAITGCESEPTGTAAAKSDDNFCESDQAELVEQCDVEVAATLMATPDALQFSQALEMTAEVAVSGGSPFSRVALSRTLAAFRDIEGERCSTIPGDDYANFKELSGDELIAELTSKSVNWYSMITDDELASLAGFLGQHFDQQSQDNAIRVFYGTRAEDVCGGWGGVAYALLWDTSADQVSLLLFDIEWE